MMACQTPNAVAFAAIPTAMTSTATAEDRAWPRKCRTALRITSTSYGLRGGGAGRPADSFPVRRACISCGVSTRPRVPSATKYQMTRPRMSCGPSQAERKIANAGAHLARMLRSRRPVLQARLRCSLDRTDPPTRERPRRRGSRVERTFGDRRERLSRRRYWQGMDGDFIAPSIDTAVQAMSPDKSDQDGHRSRDDQKAERGSHQRSLSGPSTATDTRANPFAISRSVALRQDVLGMQEQSTTMSESRSNLCRSTCRQFLKREAHKALVVPLVARFAFAHVEYRHLDSCIRSEDRD